jgi:hypothetical protein
MGEKDSSLTRVQPVFNCLLDKWPTGAEWLPRLCEMVSHTRSGSKVPSNLGMLLESEVPRERDARRGKVFERIVPPPTAFLRWLLQNPEKLQIPNEQTFGTTTEDARVWRQKLLRGTREERETVQREGLMWLEARKGSGSYRKRWAFEGWSHIDCTLVTENCVIFLEGKRTEAISASTRWFTRRSQLWRNVEAARDFAAGKHFAVVLAVENSAEGEDALKKADRSMAGSYPHLDDPARRELSKHFLGFVTWSQVVREFDLPPECLIDTVPLLNPRPVARRSPR